MTKQIGGNFYFSTNGGHPDDFLTSVKEKVLQYKKILNAKRVIIKDDKGDGLSYKVNFFA